jgi:hypothetical protein
LKSQPEGAELFLSCIFLPAPGEADNISTMRISMTIAAQYPTMTRIIEMTL